LVAILPLESGLSQHFRIVYPGSDDSMSIDHETENFF
jgi:hypothetical protein